MGVHFSSARDGEGSTDRWGTPLELLSAAAARWGPFDLDAAADADNAKAPRYLTRDDDALACQWHGRVWLNPPYSKIAPFMAHAARESWSGRCRVVALPPARTTTRWWHRWVMRAELVALLDGRLVFDGHARPTEANPDRGHGAELDSGCPGCADSAPFPSALVVFGSAPATPKVVAMDRRGRMGPHLFKCGACGEPFRATRRDARACSGRCRMRLSRGR